MRGTARGRVGGRRVFKKDRSADLQQSRRGWGFQPPAQRSPDPEGLRRGGLPSRRPARREIPPDPPFPKGGTYFFPLFERGTERGIASNANLFKHALRVFQSEMERRSQILDFRFCNPQSEILNRKTISDSGFQVLQSPIRNPKGGK